MLPLTFANPSDYDKITPNDKISLVGLAQFAPGKVSLCVYLNVVIVVVIILVVVKIIKILIVI